MRMNEDYLAYDMDEKLDEMVKISLVNLGSLLAKSRWDKATPEQRAEQNRKMLAGRRKKARRKK